MYINIVNFLMFFFVRFVVCLTHIESHKTRKLLKCEMNVPYGRKSNQTVDFYFPKDVKEGN